VVILKPPSIAPPTAPVAADGLEPRSSIAT
jgi:hypothetical protein